LHDRTVQFLSVDETLAIHEKLIARFGGSEGVRDPGLLESALFRPQTGYYDDLVSMAAALFESLLLNHAFVDGNKRVAFFATDVFLRLNGWKLSVDGIEAHRFLMANLEAGTCNYEALQIWIRANAVVI
jgi:death-on-curing protein